MAISSKSVMKLSGSLFRKGSFGGKELNGAAAKAAVAKMAYGGRSVGNMNEKLKKAGVSENIRKSYLKAFEPKKKDEKPKVGRINMVHAMQGEQNNSASGIHGNESRYRFGSYGGGNKTSVSILGGVGRGIKGSAQDLIKK